MYLSVDWNALAKEKFYKDEEAEVGFHIFSSPGELEVGQWSVRLLSPFVVHTFRLEYL